MTLAGRERKCLLTGDNAYCEFCAVTCWGYPYNCVHILPVGATSHVGAPEGSR
jgi:hypothetical protein